jgi:lipopolysaccharide export system permease protein
MKLLDKYILKNFLVTFFFTVIIFVVVISVIDFTENNDDFIKNNVPYSKVISVYYLNYFPYIANMLSPILVFIATVIVTARLAARTEIIAMFNSGMSFLRILLPYFMGSVFIAGLIFILIGWIIPDANKVRVDFENTYIKPKIGYDAVDVHQKVSPETYLYMKNYNTASQTGYDFTLETIKGNRLESKLKANRISWIDSTQKWNLNEYSIRKIDSAGKEILLTGSNKDTLLDVGPKDFELNGNPHETLTLTELEAHIKKLQERGSEEVPVYLTEKYERYTYPFAIIILTIIGVIVSARKSRQGTGFQIAFGFLLAMIYILFVILGRSVSQVGSVGPLAAAWTPNIVFSIIGFIMYKTLPR